MVRDLGSAEELAQDALVAALEQWPASGIPDNPAAWLTAAAKHRAIDHFRRHKRLEQKHQELKYQQEGQQNVPRISSSSRPPIVEFNRAVAIAMAFGPEAGPMLHAALPRAQKRPAAGLAFNDGRNNRDSDSHPYRFPDPRRP
jgi:predicted RNA polymerase sigma factor